MFSDDDWLRPRLVQCDNCGVSIFQVDHSPMDDSWRVYCNRCPRSVAVSFYDHVVKRIQHDVPPAEDKRAFFSELQSRLKPCDCGGQFRFDAVRRCYRCSTEITDDCNVDLYKYFGLEFTGRDPTPDEEAANDRWLREFIRTDGIWR